ncbi:glycosyltransferase [Candidatus Saccharibacteria bacterium]|nr:glycosyltransferase [Candidatus Saccharibacteria bacterium]
MKRLLLFSHYNKYDYLSEHVVFLLKNLQKYYDQTVFISNSELTPKDQNRLSGLQSSIITRKNEGYDFAAWRDALLSFDQKELSGFDSVTIMNDTCFGPVYSFDAVFESMESEKVDFWGMVTHRRISASDSPNGLEIPKHLQSFFITFNKNVVASKVFQDFWDGIVDHSDVNEVIMNYETRLTQLLSDSGFKYSSFFDSSDTEAASTKSVASGANFTIYSPERCLDAKVPLVKIKAFTHHSYPRYLVEKIHRETIYPIEIVENYFNEYFDPNQQLIMFDKMLDESVSGVTAQLKVGVHLHAFYMDVAEEFISRFNKWSFDFDLYVTVSNDELKEKVSKILGKYKVDAKKILVIPNRGYAAIPWMTVSQKYLQAYDIVGHFHTKKDAHMDEWVGKTWTDDLMKMLVDPAEEIVNNFASNEKLGIVIPDVPRHARYLGAEMYYSMHELRGIISSLYGRMNIDSARLVNTDHLLAYIYPYGMMYWYRPAALDPITELVFSEREVPHGKLPDTTVLHAIERLFVYVAWGKGYDYRISKLRDYTSEFITTLSVNKQGYNKERNTPLLTIGIKGAVKDKTKRVLKKVVRRLPTAVKVRLIRLRSFMNKRSSVVKTDPTIKFLTHELSNTGGPRVALDLFTQIKNDPTITSSYCPELYVPEGARTDKDLERDLSNHSIVVRSFRADNLVFNKGDIVVMNTIAYPEAVFAVILYNLEAGVIQHVYVYPHEFIVDNYLSAATIAKIAKLIKQNKLTLYASAEQARGAYVKYFNENEIKLMPNRIDIDSNAIFSRDKNDFDKIRFVITGTPDARKGELDVLYAFTSFYNNYYKANTNKYRDFSLTIVGLTDNFRDVYNKLYSDRLRAAAKGLGERVVLYEQQPEKKCLEIIKESNFTVLYSLYENLPRVVFDGLAYGHPVLRNDCSGYEEQLIDGVNGWKSSTEDWEGLVKTIEEILNKKLTSNDKLASMSKESAKIATKYATAEYIIIEDIKSLADQEG